MNIVTLEKLVDVSQIENNIQNKCVWNGKYMCIQNMYKL